MSTLKDISPVTRAMHEHAFEAATTELRYHIERRDRLNDRIRFGLIALNGASLLALIGALGGDGEAAHWLGFTSTNAMISACCFTFGLLAAGLSVTSQQTVTIKEAGDASARALVLSRLLALYEQPSTSENHERLGKAMEEYSGLELTGFQFNPRSFTAQGLAASAWLIGIAIPLLYALSIRIF
jgi:hypothetical protein